MRSITTSKWKIPLIFALLLSWSGGAAVAFLTEGEAHAVKVEPESAEAAVYPFTSEGYFLGGHCYISCTNGSFFTVPSFSTSQCCQSCLDLCSTDLCTSSGQGVAVLCGF